MKGVVREERGKSGALAPPVLRVSFQELLVVVLFFVRYDGPLERTASDAGDNV